MSQISSTPPAATVAQSASNPSTFTPQSPFDETGDVILRSSDGVDFRVHQVVMSLASPIFATMFTLPQPEKDPEPINMPESAVVLDQMLRFWYPGTEPLTIESLEELHAVVEILISKYDVQSAVYTAKSHVREYLKTEPVAVYAIACTQGWEDLARTAARESLKHPIRVFDYDAAQSLKHITADAYHRLMQYHYLCGTAAKGVTTSLRWVTAPNNWVWFSCRSCTTSPTGWYLSDGQAYPTRLWFTNFRTSVGEALSRTPGISLLDSNLLPPALKEASKCSVCREQVHEQLFNWVSTALSPKVQELINGVQLKFT
ncbi:hypothetical protein MSAN_01054400 [Mycena sanguinolenta]|uniref:BTB domain-containing protein n=1 Tax=Mycena sanguinolenta TaxID=230812 RepID=A0A8H6YMP8_9AGAR|nr:hypothetical protein MSAN_01054400 [Mycena sanguinolenta]